MLRLTLLALFSVAVGGCLQGGSFDCVDESQCLRADDVIGECRLGWCAYPAPECESELKFSAHAGNGLAGLCVGVDTPGSGPGSEVTGQQDVDPTTTTTTTSTSTETSTTSTTETCAISCDTPPSPCMAAREPCVAATEACVWDPVDTGTVCSGADLCMVSNCNEAGECLPVSEVDCSGGPCTVGAGVCNPATGECDYDPVSEGTMCDDGNACTEGDTCDGAGACTPGPTCPGAPVCGTRTCVGGECVSGNAANGTSCGELDGDRCCGGACTNVSMDPDNCGGCGIGCAPQRPCNRADEPPCVPVPPFGRSGRCECLTDLHCPVGQVCDLVSGSGTELRCIPEAGRNACPDQEFDYPNCGGYCYYD